MAAVAEEPEAGEAAEEAARAEIPNQIPNINRELSRMAQLIEKELSYKLVGLLFAVYNTLGGGYQEKYYQKAIAKEFERNGIKFQEQLIVPLDFKGSSIGRYFLDFLVERKIIVEIKSASKIYMRDVKQILSYLKRSDLELGILANFSRNGLEFRRVLKGSQ